MIEIKHLYKAFDNHMVLRNLNMKINDGAIYGFVGPNGAGKTTTMRIIAGLLKADSGQILIDGMDIGSRHKEIQEPDMSLRRLSGSCENREERL